MSKTSLEKAFGKIFCSWPLTARRRSARIFAFCVIIILAATAGCAERSAAPLPPVAFSMDGPALALVAKYKGIELEGSMDRTCMVGLGKLHLQSRAGATPSMYCEARLNLEPTEKGRVRGILDCTDGVLMLLSLRNLGPDQGIGIARQENGDQDLMVLFYHPSKEEAERRLPAAAEDMKKAQKKL